jgi:hypothetical protein
MVEIMWHRRETGGNRENKPQPTAMEEISLLDNGNILQE